MIRYMSIICKMLTHIPGMKKRRMFVSAPNPWNIIANDINIKIRCVVVKIGFMNFPIVQ